VLAIWQHCSKLVKVNLSGCWNIDDSAFSTLSKNECAKTLRVVELCNCWRLTAKAIEYLSDCKLSHLDLSYCKSLDDKTWPALAFFADSLRWLSLCRISSITDASIEGIFGVAFKELAHLDVSECPFLTDAFVACILQVAPNLRSLSLAFNSGLRGNFLHSVHLPSLKLLDLRHVQKWITDDFCRKLVENCPNVEELKLDGCKCLNDEVFLHLTAGLGSLRKIGIAGCTELSEETNKVIKLKYQ